LTAKVDSPRPTKESVQNGPISADRDRRPCLRQTQRRFSSNDGTVPTAVAITLAHPGVTVLRATRTARTVRLMLVEMADTPA
jgi:hypothetical protein